MVGPPTTSVEGGVCDLVLIIPLHAARRAMAAASVEGGMMAKVHIGLRAWATIGAGICTPISKEEK